MSWTCEDLPVVVPALRSITPGGQAAREVSHHSAADAWQIYLRCRLVQALHGYAGGFLVCKGPCVMHYVLHGVLGEFLYKI